MVVDEKIPESLLVLWFDRWSLAGCFGFEEVSIFGSAIKGNVNVLVVSFELYESSKNYDCIWELEDLLRSMVLLYVYVLIILSVLYTAQNN